MTILSDHEITYYATREGMIAPFEPSLVRQLKGKAALSFGTSSYGYDFRLADDPGSLKVVPPILGITYNDWPNGHITTPILDPKAPNPNIFVPADIHEDENGRYILIPPNSFALGRTVERFNIPRHLMTICIGKSSYARIGTIPHITPFEPEWRGHATLEISNTAPLPSRLYLGEGIAQLIFLRASSTCNTSYADRQGKYQDQPAQIVMATV